MVNHLNVVMEQVALEHHSPSTSGNAELPSDAFSRAEVELKEGPPSSSSHVNDIQENITSDDTSTLLSENVVADSEFSHVTIEQARLDSHFPVDSSNNEILSDVPPDEEENYVESLLGTADQGDIRRNYEVYNRMEGCSSDEETQTDNDDDNSIEDEVEVIAEHHYAVLNDDVEFGDFTGAENYTVENLCHEDDENDWAEPVTGASVGLTNGGNNADNAPRETMSAFTATFVDQASPLPSDADTDRATQPQQPLNEDRSGTPTPTPKFVSIQPLTAGIDVKRCTNVTPTYIYEFISTVIFTDYCDYVNGFSYLN